MQPNQQNQDQNQPPQPAAMPYQVPDYLGLDPRIVSPVRPKKNTRRIVLLAGLLLAVLIVAGVATWLMTQMSPEQRFYKALENSMSVKYVTRAITSVSDDSSKKLIVKVESDFSNISSPMTRIAYEYSQAASASTAAFSLGADILHITRDERYARIKHAPVDFLGPSTKLNSWYKLPYSGSMYLDPFKLDEAYGSSSAQVVYGNFTADKRQQALDLIRANKVYTIQEDKGGELEHKNAISYKVTVDRGGLNSLVQRLTASYGVGGEQVLRSKDDSYLFVVDTASNRITQISYIAASGGKNNSTVSNTELLTYPESVEIDKPTTFTEWEPSS